jgi:hypothetical protein
MGSLDDSRDKPRQPTCSGSEAAKPLSARDLDLAAAWINDYVRLTTGAVSITPHEAHVRHMAARIVELRGHAEYNAGYARGRTEERQLYAAYFEREGSSFAQEARRGRLGSFADMLFCNFSEGLARIIRDGGHLT